LAQIFPEWTNKLPLVAGIAGPVLTVLLVGGVWYYGSPKYLEVGYRPHQPVPYSHELHVGELGLDCRYCHASVETSPVANVPPTRVCMNCHTILARDSEKLAPVRTSYETGMPVQWVRVHHLPDYAYFHHAAHVRAGVGCVSCHGRIDQMEEVMQVEPLSMGWCLDCHRNPAPSLRPTEEVTNMSWTPPENQLELAASWIAEREIDPPVECSGCHR
jgi:hypothetical protein